MTDEAKPPMPPVVREWMSQMGVKGGRIGGTATGKKKKRSPEHYQKMVAARNAQRAAKRAATAAKSNATEP